MLRLDAMKVALTRSPTLYSLARRPYATGRYLLRRPHERDFAAFALFEGDGPFVDVGANAGMSALSFRIYKRRNPIISVEPNPFHEGDLRWTGRLVRRFDYRLWAAGAEDGSMILYVPVFRGVPMTADASLRRDWVVGSRNLRQVLGDRMDGPDFEVVSREVPVRRLDAAGLAPAFVKLDVQGFEYDAVLGMRETLERHRPVLMVESISQELRDLLATLGYESLAYDPVRHALTPSPRGESNTFFRPVGG